MPVYFGTTESSDLRYKTGRRYQTALVLYRICEILGWIIVVLGASYTLWGIWGGKVGLAKIPIGTVVSILGLLLVVASQLMLIFIDTENNTRQTVAELHKTNAMLEETLGRSLPSLTL